MKIPLVRAEMFCTDGGIHMPKLRFPFRCFTNALKIKKMDCKINYYKCKKKLGVYNNTLEIEVGAL